LTKRGCLCQYFGRLILYIAVKLLGGAVFLLLLPFFVVFEGKLYYSQLAKEDVSEKSLSLSLANQALLYLDLEEERSAYLRSTVIAADARPVKLKNYLEFYRSPLLPYAQNLCEAADKYRLDYRLLVAIAQQESNLCKTSRPEWFNCWGWGIHSKGIKTYENYPQAIEDVANGLSKNYCDKGYCEDPCVMMKKYTPNSNGSWCFGIKKFLAEIEYGF